MVPCSVRPLALVSASVLALVVRVQEPQEPEQSALASQRVSLGLLEPLASAPAPELERSPRERVRLPLERVRSPLAQGQGQGQERRPELVAESPTP